MSVRHDPELHTTACTSSCRQRAVFPVSRYSPLDRFQHITALEKCELIGKEANLWRSRSEPRGREEKRQHRSSTRRAAVCSIRQKEVLCTLADRRSRSEDSRI